MTVRGLGLALGLGAAGVWVGYAWGPHLLTPVLLRRGPRGAWRIALTFDDGPDAAWTPRVLETLEARAVRGSFFLVGERAERARDVVRAIAAAGHDVANHGWSHRSLWLSSPGRTDTEIGRAQSLLTDLAGQAPVFFRPPWGMVNAAMFGALRRYGLRCVLWSIQPEGLRPQPGDRQAAHVRAHARPGAIVDLHDADGVPGAPARLLPALPAMIDGLRDAGYTLVPLRELLAPPDGAASAPPLP